MLLHSCVESAEGGVSDVNVLADALDQRFPCGEMDFTDGRRPQFLAEARLFKNESRTFVDARQESGAVAQVRCDNDCVHPALMSLDLFDQRRGFRYLRLDEKQGPGKYERTQGQRATYQS